MNMIDRSADNVKILELTGRFDSYTAPEAQKWIEKATLTEPAYVVINLSGVHFLDSTALSTLVHGVKRSRERNGDLRLCGMQQSVRLIFELTRLDKIFEIFVSEEDAVRNFPGE